MNPAISPPYGHDNCSISVNAKYPYQKRLDTTPRNATCPCGSGTKYKRCCLLLHQTAEKVDRLNNRGMLITEDLAETFEHLEHLANGQPEAA